MVAQTLKHDYRDAVILALTLYGEARGLDTEGQTKVAWVIRNRASRARFVGNSHVGAEGAVAKACMMPWQFSCWNESDPNSAFLHEALRLYDRGQLVEQIEPQLAVAEAVLAGTIPDPTNGADHYHTIRAPRWAHSWPPYWAAKMAVACVDPGTGGHVFYNSAAP